MVTDAATTATRSARNKAAAGRRDAEGVEVRSTSVSSEEWDNFLESSPLGEYQQTSMWAVGKEFDGWQVEREVVRGEDDEIRAGFQILWKRSKFGPIGYVSRGPVLPSQKAAEALELVDGLIATARSLRLAALIVQVPRADSAMAQALADRGMVPNRLFPIITATWAVRLEGGLESMLPRMRSTTRKKYRQAVRRGVVIREGNEEDLGAFFEMMGASCERQGVSPNPRSVESLRVIWSAFAARGRCRLTLAEHEGRAVAGLFCLRFGERIHFWKKGMFADFQHLHPTELLYCEALGWGADHDHHIADFEGVGRELAETVIAGETLSGSMRRSRDFYNIGFGGDPELLREAKVWFRSALVRKAYEVATCSSLGVRWLRKCQRD